MLKTMSTLFCQVMKATGVLYQNLYQEIVQIAWPSRITRDKALAFVQSFLRKRQIENTEPVEYTDLAYVYLLQKLGSKYRQIFKPLLENKILQSTQSYKVGYHDLEGNYIKGQCLSYRINPELMDDEVIKVQYDTPRKKQRCRDAVTMKSKRLMRQLRIPDMNSRELIQFVKTSLTDTRIREMLKVDDEITDEVIMLKTLVRRSRSKKGRVTDEKNVEEGRADGQESSQDKSASDLAKGDRVGEKPQAKEYQIKHIKRSALRLKTKSLIKDGKFCYIDHLDVYIKRKRRHLTRSYCDQLLRIKHRNVYADRNETNLRLDSNLTNLKSDFIGMLQMDGQRLGQIDLKNSQFRFFVMLLEQAERDILYGRTEFDFPISEFSPGLAAKQSFILRIKEEGKIEGNQVTLLSILFERHCIKKSGSLRSLSADYRVFRKLVKTGQLYEHIMQVHWAETGEEITRGEAKKMMFGISFSSHRYWPEAKRIIAKAFPSIVALMDDFKKEMVLQYNKDVSLSDKQSRDKGNASFAVMLQQVESLVFIDKILDQCHQSGIKALSKHDSIVFRQCDRSYVAAIIIRVLNKIFGKFSYSLDVDGQLFILKPKKQSRFVRKAFEVMHDLFTSANRANAPPAMLAQYQITSAAKRKDYRYKAAPTYAYNARAPRPQDPGLKPLKNKRLQRLREKWYG